jgi:hypothetical protein
MPRGRPKGSRNKIINTGDVCENKIKHLTPIRSIRAKCLDCSNGQHGEIKDCPMFDCPLYNFRLGKNPNRKGKGGFCKDKVEPEKSEEVYIPEDDFGKD